MYVTRTGLILGFHGCDQSIVDKVLKGKASLKPSTNRYDWLGHGIYFWDNSPSRALEFATKIRDNPPKSGTRIKNPAVVGAVINLGYCLDLLDYENLQFVQEAYDVLMSTYRSAGLSIPKNKTVGVDKDLLIRDLDCAVIQLLHQVRIGGKKRSFDSVRGMFSEGKELYDNAGFKVKDHIQICVRNPNCIKGYFLPRKEDEDHEKV